MRVDGRASFLKFVYPVVFDPQQAYPILSRFADLSWDEAPVWIGEPFPDEDLVRHVADYLNAGRGTSLQDSGSEGSAASTEHGHWTGTAQLFVMATKALESRSGLGAHASWSLRVGHSREIAFSLDRVEFALFRAGVAFLTLDVKPSSDQLNDWLDLAHYFRFVRGRRACRVRAKWRVGYDSSTDTALMESYAPPVASAGWIAEEGGHLGDIIDGLLAAGGNGSDDWTNEVFIPGQMLPFVAYYLDDSTEEEVAPTVFRVGRTLHSKQAVELPEGLLTTASVNLLQYARDQWFIFSLDGGAFVAFDAPRDEFFRNTLPDHLTKQYFLLFLIALHQRFGLMRLSAAVCDTHDAYGKDVEARAIAFERIRDQLLDFTTRGLFSQAMQRQNHHDVYVRWQAAFQLDRLYAEVRDEVHDLLERAEYDLARERSRRARVIEQIGIAVGFPALLLGFLGVNIKAVTNGRGIGLWSALGLVGSALLLGLVAGRIVQVWRKSVLG